MNGNFSIHESARRGVVVCERWTGTRSCSVSRQPMAEKKVKKPAALIETQKRRNSNHKDYFQKATDIGDSIVVNRVILNLKILYRSSGYTITSRTGNFSCISQSGKNKAQVFIPTFTDAIKDFKYENGGIDYSPRAMNANTTIHLKERWSEMPKKVKK